MLRLCPNTLAGKRDRALLALGFAGAFRRSELVALEVEDLSDVPDGLRVRIRRSKTDQSGEGHEIAIPRGYRPCARWRRCRRGSSWQKSARACGERPSPLGVTRRPRPHGVPRGQNRSRAGQSSSRSPVSCISRPPMHCAPPMPIVSAL